MRDEIVRFMKNISPKNSERKAREMVANQFNGILTSNHRYVKIDNVEYCITKNPDNTACGGWNIKAMDWGIGNDWRFAKPY